MPESNASACSTQREREREMGFSRHQQWRRVIFANESHFQIFGFIHELCALIQMLTSQSFDRYLHLTCGRYFHSREILTPSGRNFDEWQQQQLTTLAVCNRDFLRCDWIVQGDNMCMFLRSWKLNCRSIASLRIKISRMESLGFPTTLCCDRVRNPSQKSLNYKEALVASGRTFPIISAYFSDSKPSFRFINYSYFFILLICTAGYSGKMF